MCIVRPVFGHHILHKTYAYLSTINHVYSFWQITVVMQSHNSITRAGSTRLENSTFDEPKLITWILCKQCKFTNAAITNTIYSTTNMYVMNKDKTLYMKLTRNFKTSKLCSSLPTLSRGQWIPTRQNPAMSTGLWRPTLRLWSALSQDGHPRWSTLLVMCQCHSFVTIPAPIVSLVIDRISVGGNAIASVRPSVYFHSVYGTDRLLSVDLERLHASRS